MTIAFDLYANPAPAVRGLRVLVVALAAGGFGLAAWLAAWPWSGVLAVLAPLAGVLAWRHGGRQLATGHLIVDQTGDGHWLAQGGSPQALARAQPVRIERWCVTERLVWIRFSANGGGRAHDALIARDACEAAQWRSLRTWLTWLGRGAA